MSERKAARGARRGAPAVIAPSTPPSGAPSNPDSAMASGGDTPDFYSEAPRAVLPAPTTTDVPYVELHGATRVGGMSQAFRRSRGDLHAVGFGDEQGPAQQQRGSMSPIKSSARGEVTSRREKRMSRHHSRAEVLADDFDDDGDEVEEHRASRSPTGAVPSVHGTGYSTEVHMGEGVHSDAHRQRLTASPGPRVVDGGGQYFSGDEPMTDHHPDEMDGVGRSPSGRFQSAPVFPPRVLPPPTPAPPLSEALEQPPPLPMPAANIEPIKLVVRYMLSRDNARCTIGALSEHLDWEHAFEEEYGDLRSFLQLYSALLVTSPIGDIVTFRDAAKFVGSRRVTKADRRSLLSYSASIGHVGCTSIARRVRLDDLHVVYRRRGLACTLVHDSILHVEYPDVFDMFVFDNGAVVWWGLSRADHWIVEADFLSHNHVTGVTLVERHDLVDVNHLFPIWWTYSVSETTANDTEQMLMDDAEHSPTHANSGGGLEGDDGSAALNPRWRRAAKAHDKTQPRSLLMLTDHDMIQNRMSDDAHANKRFAEALPHDHFVIPANDRVNVMMAVSCALAQSVTVDYLEFKIGDLSQTSMKLPLQLRTLHDGDADDDGGAEATEAKSGNPASTALQTHGTRYPELHAVYRMAGDLFVYKADEFNLTEEPLLIWEKPRYRDYYDMAMKQLNLLQRAEWLRSRVQIISETVGAMAHHVHQKNMIRADWLLILLLLVDSIVLLARLVVAIFFSVERNGGAADVSSAAAYAAASTIPWPPPT